MTKDELILIKELIKESVRAVIKEEIESINRKDFKQVKLLLAKLIKESSNNTGEFMSEGNAPRKGGSTFSKEELRNKIYGGDPIKPRPSNPIQTLNISQEQAQNISLNGTLPNIDAPIPFIDKSSIMWKSMKEKIE